MNTVLKLVINSIDNADDLHINNLLYMFVDYYFMNI